MRVGVDAISGGVLTGWAHCVQSLGFILSTRLGTLLMARDFGSDVPGMIDKPGTPRMIAGLTGAIADAFARDEPAFALSAVRVVALGADGVAMIQIEGTFYPDGHLGDFTTGAPVAAPLAARLAAPIPPLAGGPMIVPQVLA